MAEPGPQPRGLRHLAPADVLRRNTKMGGDAHHVGQRPTYSSEARQRARADGKGLGRLWRALSGWARKGSEWAVETLFNQIRTLRGQWVLGYLRGAVENEDREATEDGEAEVGGLLGGARVLGQEWLKEKGEFSSRLARLNGTQIGGEMRGLERLEEELNLR